MSTTPQVMPEALRHDWLNLSALIEETARRQVVPCFNGLGLPHGYWTSESKAERDEAAKDCGACPVVTQCRQYGIDHPKELGVYGGLSERERAKEAS